MKPKFVCPTENYEGCRKSSNRNFAINLVNSD